VKDYLLVHYPNLTWNSSIGFECGNFRPDILIDCKTHFIVVEVDENQHKGYLNECEQSRMSNITFALGLPVVFVRFNPDSWKMNHIDKAVKMTERMEFLLRRIRFWENKPDMSIEYLYYDDKELPKEYKKRKLCEI